MKTKQQHLFKSKTANPKLYLKLSPMSQAFGMENYYLSTMRGYMQTADENQPAIYFRRNAWTLAKDRPTYFATRALAIEAAAKVGFTDIEDVTGGSQ